MMTPSMLPGLVRFVCEGQDAGSGLRLHEKAGREDDEVNIVVLKGTKGASATIGRTRGFNEVAKVQRNWNIFAAGRRRIYHSQRKRRDGKASGSV